MSAGKLACTCLFVVAALANGAAAQDTGRATPGATGHPARLLDVPFVPQSEAL